MNNEQKCKGCGYGYSVRCGCGFCDGQAVCEECRGMHAKFATFFNSLLKAKVAERSNSVRARLFDVLLEVGSRYLSRHENDGRDRAYFFDSLRNVDAFSDPRAFEAAFRRAVQVWPFETRVLKDLTDECEIVIFERIVENTAAKLRIDNEGKEPIDLVRDIRRKMLDLENKDRRRRLAAI
jgi:hypothetical protein